MADDSKDEAEDVGPDRSEDFASSEECREKLLKLYNDVQLGFEAQAERTDDLLDYWDTYNCELNGKQKYNGESQIFVPIIRDAVRARVVRFTNQLFPTSGRHVECISSDPSLPRATMALAEHYVRKANLRQLVPALVANGDIEGHYHVYLNWAQHSRYTVRRKKSSDPLSTEDEIEEEELKASHPEVEILADSDVCVLPATSDSLTSALEAGGSVTILRRWGKAKLQALIDEDMISKSVGEELIEEMSKDAKEMMKDKPKEMVDAAGIKKDGRGKWALIYETWSIVKTPEGRRLCRTFFGGPEKVLSCKRNPLWCDRLPIISAPVEKIQGAFKGRSQISGVADLQYYANDVMNEAADSSMFSMMPIVMTDPEKNPKVGTMVLNLAAVWETSPNDTQFTHFPELWKSGLEIVAAVKAEVFQALSVNPAMISQGTKKKQTQAEVAQEQQVDMLTTSDAVTVIENGILTPLISLMIEMDHQYRDDTILVRQYGQMGMEASMEECPPIQMNTRYVFRWFGVESSRQAQLIQQKIAAMNVIQNIPPQMYMGYKFNMAPILVDLVESVFGPQQGRLVFEDLRSQLSEDPQKENMMLNEGHRVMAHPLDDHAMHMQVHMQGMQESGDLTGMYRIHMQEHQQLQMANAQAQQQAAMPQPGQGGANPSQPGGQATGPRRPEQPAGAVHPDQMQGTQAPRARGLQ